MMHATTHYNKATLRSPAQQRNDERAAELRQIARRNGGGITIEQVMERYQLSRYQANTLLATLRRSGRAVPPTIKAETKAAGPVCPNCQCADVEPWQDGYYCAGNCAAVFTTDGEVIA